MNNLLRVGSLVGLLAVLPINLYATNLQEVIEQSVLSNPSILEQYNQKISVEYEVKVASGGFLPQIDVDAGGGYKRTESYITREAGGGARSYTAWDAKVALKQLLFDGYLTSSETARQKKRVESAFFELYNLAEEIAVKSVEVYVNVLLYQANVEFAEANLASHEKMYDQVEMRSMLGADDKSSLSQMRSRLNLALSNVESEKNNLNDRWTEYLEIVGSMPKDALEDVEFNITLPETYEETLDFALANHPAIARSKSDIEQFKLQKQASKSFYYPRVDLELSSDWQDTNNKEISSLGRRNTQSAMLRFNYNIYNGGSDLARVNKDQFLRQGADERLEYQRRRVEKDVGYAWHTYQSSQIRLAYLDDYVKSTIETSTAYLQQFQIGERTLLDLLNTENEIFEARKQFLKVKYENVLAKYRVLTSMGLMLEKTKVKLFTDEYYQAADINDEVVNDLQEKNQQHHEREKDKRDSSDEVTEMRFFKMNNNLKAFNVGRRESK